MLKYSTYSFVSAKDNKKLTFMYLANDVIQNSKKKGPEYGNEFGQILTKAFQHLSSIQNNERIKSSLSRLLTIWKERDVYDDWQITEFQLALSKFFLYYYYLGFKLKNSKM